jgi:hypothetical protein
LPGIFILPWTVSSIFFAVAFAFMIPRMRERVHAAGRWPRLAQEIGGGAPEPLAAKHAESPVMVCRMERASRLG